MKDEKQSKGVMNMVINKYVIMDGAKGMSVVVFSENLQHSDIVVGRNVRSAGWVRVFEGRVKCYGDSESLSKKSLPEDTNIVAKTIFGDESTTEKCGEHECVCHDDRIGQYSNNCIEGNCKECEGNIDGVVGGVCWCDCHGLQYEH